ncbi:hypothetical protein DMC30DRAFT_261024 [Rhodotorula diobovata]|uniref:Uncharacterized protein n=1 Tax=Rhodotorula diobovata TaxID=5288 RepID=A0A5C5G6A6_9BASI|nr:hypothetical protein DMC30DRAFT_261024 [Rhodotorula diobovata]
MTLCRLQASPTARLSEWSTRRRAAPRASSASLLGVTTTTTTVDYTATVTESDVTVLTTSTEIVEASTPLTTRTRTRTVRLLPSRTTTTVIVFSDAPTPLATRASTRTVRAPLSVLRSVLFPTTTLTVQTTTTLPTPLATTTVTVDEQSSACFVEVGRPLLSFLSPAHPADALTPSGPFLCIPAARERLLALPEHELCWHCSEDQGERAGEARPRQGAERREERHGRLRGGGGVHVLESV